MIICFVIFEFGLRTSAYQFFLQLRSWPIRVKNVRDQNMQISTVDATRCLKPSSHHIICEEQAKEWKVFREWRACFSELQSTT